MDFANALFVPLKIYFTMFQLFAIILTYKCNKITVKFKHFTCDADHLFVFGGIPNERIV